MTQSMKIRPAEASDAPAIRALIRSAYAMYVERIGREPAPMQADVPALVAHGGIHVLHSGPALLGSIRLSVVDQALEVNDLVVDPAVQGQGLGRKLMTFAEETARAKGLAALTLYTNEKMVESLALYPCLGFVETGRRVDDGFNRVFFRKDLAPAQLAGRHVEHSGKLRTKGSEA